MTRTFEITSPTPLKIGTIDNLSTLKHTQFTTVSKGTILTTEDDISMTDDNHFLVKVHFNIYKNHIKEIHPKVDTILPYQIGVQLFKSRYTQGIHTDLQRCLTLFNINTTPRIRHFLSQCGHESAGLRYRVELASGNAYEWRRDLGNTQPGDGVKFKGGGFIQLTGRSNYYKLFKATNDIKVMEKGATYVGRVYPWTSAGVWWDANNMNTYCDRGDTVRQITRRVNGGYNGLADRERWYRLTAIV